MAPCEDSLRSLRRLKVGVCSASAEIAARGVCLTFFTVYLSFLAMYLSLGYAFASASLRQILAERCKTIVAPAVRVLWVSSDFMNTMKLWLNVEMVKVKN